MGKVDLFGNTPQTLTLESYVVQDEITKKVSQAFDYVFDGKIVENIELPKFPQDFQIGLIVGSSGSGKSTLLKSVFCNKEIEQTPQWDNRKSIASHFDSYDDASNKLGAVGLNSIPTWLKPYRVLSNGEKFRVDLARQLHNDSQIDEFTSVVNREVAVSCSISIEKYIRRNNLQRIVFCSCHRDIITHLKPDWCYDTDEKRFIDWRYLRREPFTINVHECSIELWERFRKHHYLSGEINKVAKCYCGEINGQPICFAAILPMPTAIKHAYREHRVVVLPDYQGMGIGNRFSEFIGQHYIEMGCKYYAKTANPRMGQHRNHSPLWRATSMNEKDRKDYVQQDGKVDPRAAFSLWEELARIHANRVCFCHEYIGDGITYTHKDDIEIIDNVSRKKLW